MWATVASRAPGTVAAVAPRTLLLLLLPALLLPTAHAAAVLAPAPWRPPMAMGKAWARMADVPRRASLPAMAVDTLEFTVENVNTVLEEIRPYLISDGGNVEVVSVEPEAKRVELRLQGACSSCPSSTTTMAMGIERVLRENWSDLGEVVDVGATPELSIETAVDALQQIMPAIDGLGGSVQVVSAQGGKVVLEYTGPEKIKYGIELCALPDAKRASERRIRALLACRRRIYPPPNRRRRPRCPLPRRVHSLGLVNGGAAYESVLLCTSSFRCRHACAASRAVHFATRHSSTTSSSNESDTPDAPAQRRGHGYVGRARGGRLTMLHAPACPFEAMREAVAGVARFQPPCGWFEELCRVLSVSVVCKCVLWRA